MMPQEHAEPMIEKEIYDALHCEYIERGHIIVGLTREIRALNESHKKEIMKLNDACIAIRRKLEEEITSLTSFRNCPGVQVANEGLMALKQFVQESLNSGDGAYRP